MSDQRGRLAGRGPLQIPADVRRAHGLNDGDAVSMRIVDGALHVRPLRDVIARVQAHFREHLSEELSLVDELIAYRRAEAEMEERE